MANTQIEESFLFSLLIFQDSTKRERERQRGISPQRVSCRAKPESCYPHSLHAKLVQYTHRESAGEKESINKQAPDSLMYSTPYSAACP